MNHDQYNQYIRRLHFILKVAIAVWTVALLLNIAVLVLKISNLTR
jgi:hypothetical protein